MTVHGDIERAIAMAEAAKGSYLLFATESEDNQATQVFEDMAQDMDRHVKILESRRDYLQQHNNLIQNDGNQGGNNQGQGGNNQGQGGNNQGQGGNQNQQNQKKQQNQDQNQS